MSEYVTDKPLCTGDLTHMVIDKFKSEGVNKT